MSKIRRCDAENSFSFKRGVKKAQEDIREEQAVKGGDPRAAPKRIAEDMTFSTTF
jgi:hypothetical protein